MGNKNRNSLFEKLCGSIGRKLYPEDRGKIVAVFPEWDDLGNRSLADIEGSDIFNSRSCSFCKKPGPVGFAFRGTRRVEIENSSAIWGSKEWRICLGCLPDKDNRSCKKEYELLREKLLKFKYANEIERL